MSQKSRSECPKKVETPYSFFTHWLLIIYFSKTTFRKEVMLTFQEPITNVELNFLDMKRKKIKPGVVYALRAFSFYDEKTNKRKILKSEATGRNLSNILFDGNKNNITQTLKKLQSDGIVTTKGDYYIIKDIPNGTSFRSIPTAFMKELLKTRSSDYIVTYLWLHRRYHQKTSMSKEPLFTIGDILRQVFDVHSKSKTSYDRVASILAEMVNDGLLEFAVVRIGRTYLRKIFAVNERFYVRDVIKENIKKVPEKSDYKDSDDKEFEDVEIEETYPIVESPMKIIFKLHGALEDGRTELTWPELQEYLYNLDGDSFDWCHSSVFGEDNIAILNEHNLSILNIETDKSIRKKDLTS